MSVEDAISMYLDGFSDVTEEPASPGFGDDSKMRPISPRPPTELTYDDGHSSDENSPDLHPSNDLPPVPPLSELTSVDRNLQDEQFLKETNDEEPPAESSNQKDTQETQETPAVNPSETKVLLSGVVPPPLLTGTQHRDRYGFRKKTNYITLEQYEAWNGPYSEFVASRRVKWAELLKENGLPTSEPTVFPAKSSKMKRFVRKGIPSEFRGAAWFWYAGGFDLLKRNPGLYDRLVKEAMDSPNNDDKEHIERDLHRTFPDNVHFKPEFVDEAMTSGTSSGSSNPKYSSVTVETQMIQSLRRVLYAFSLYNPRVGYTQSLNFITGMLLLFLPEEKAFWMLHIVTSVYLPGTHEISLEGANIDLWILMVLLKETLPHIYNKIAGNPGRSKTPALTVDSRLPDITLGLTNWLMSLFIGSLPLETTLRVWDVFFFEGSKTFFSRVAGYIQGLREGHSCRIRSHGSLPSRADGAEETARRQRVAGGLFCPATPCRTRSHRGVESLPTGGCPTGETEAFAGDQQGSTPGCHGRVADHKVADAYSWVGAQSRGFLASNEATCL